MVVVVPIDDIKEHSEESTICECEPKVEYVNSNMIITHSAFDGRQYEEQIEELLEEK